MQNKFKFKGKLINGYIGYISFLVFMDTLDCIHVFQTLHGLKVRFFVFDTLYLVQEFKGVF